MSALSIGGGGVSPELAPRGNPGTIPIDRKLKQRAVKIK